MDRVDLSWQAALDPATVAYDVWRPAGGDKSRIPGANIINAATDPAIEPVARAVPLGSTRATDADATSARILYQVRGACIDRSEGTEHPF